MSLLMTFPVALCVICLHVPDGMCQRECKKGYPRAKRRKYFARYSIQCIRIQNRKRRKANIINTPHTPNAGNEFNSNRKEVSRPFSYKLYWENNMEAKVQITPQNFSLQVEHHFLNGRLIMSDASEAAAVGMIPNGRERVALLVTNTTASPTPAPIAYRMLTTDRKRFTVSPREGILPVGETHTIIISLNSPALAAKETETGVTAEKEGNNGDEGSAADEELERFSKELTASAKRIVEVQRSNEENSSSPLRPLRETRFIGKASFKLEYRGLFVSTAGGSNGDRHEEGFPDDTAAVAAIAAGTDNAPSISDVIKAGGRRLKKSAVMDCTTVHCIIIHDDKDGANDNEGVVHAVREGDKGEEARSVNHGKEGKEENAERGETEQNRGTHNANTVDNEEEKEHLVRGEQSGHHNASCDIGTAATIAEHGNDGGSVKSRSAHSLLLQDSISCDNSSPPNSVSPHTHHPAAEEEEATHAKKQHSTHEHTTETKGEDAMSSGGAGAVTTNDDDVAINQKRRESGARVDGIVSVAIPLLCVVGAVVTAAAVIKRARKGGAALLWL